MQSDATLSPEQLAGWFHETYERLAPQFGYETRQDTRVFDLASPNGKLMVEVFKIFIEDLWNTRTPQPPQS